VSTREDFEIYTIRSGGCTWYKFKVEYFGAYTASSLEEILKIRERVKVQVEARLEWVEEENQKYYARMAEQERRRAILLKEAKNKKPRSRKRKTPRGERIKEGA
jgi:hypothetical protein